MIRLAVPQIGAEEIKEIKKVLDSGYLVQGKKVEQFENILSEYLNIKYCIVVSSGTAALHLALLALDIKKGDEVIVPDFTFPATANVVEIVGADTRLVDIKLDSFCIDTEKIESAVTEKTKAIIPVHEFGRCADMSKIMEISRKYNLRVIEDGACALGSCYKAQMAGTIGDVGCFSFHPRKAITTGEGGLVVTNNEEIAKKIRILRNHGIDYSNGSIDFITPGFNYRMTDIQAAIGIAQIKKLDNIIDSRINIADEYKRLLKCESYITLPSEEKTEKHIYQTFHILIDQKIDRDCLKEKLKEKGIECNIGAYALHEQNYYKKKYKYEREIFPNSLTAYNQGLALPLHSELTYENIQFVSDSIKSIILEMSKF